VRLGFHISIAGGLRQAVPRAVEKKCTAFQIFTSAPSQWGRALITDDEALAFIAALKASQISEVFIHAIYLLNLASASEDLRNKSIANLADELRRAGQIGATGVIFHLGSAGKDGDPVKAREHVCGSLAEVRKLSKCETPLILENSAGAGALVGSTLDDVYSIINNSAAAEPMNFCLDTAHAFESGVPLHKAEGLEAAMSHPRIGERLRVVHANDSMTRFESHRDRHFHIGEGEIGREAFGRIVRHPRLRDVPLIMETPGDENDDRRNMETMLALTDGL
jgi:deoxyribonuclease-4